MFCFDGQTQRGVTSENTRAHNCCDGRLWGKKIRRFSKSNTSSSGSSYFQWADPHPIQYKVGDLYMITIISKHQRRIRSVQALSHNTQTDRHTTVGSAELFSGRINNQLNKSECVCCVCLITYMYTSFHWVWHFVLLWVTLCLVAFCPVWGIMTHCFDWMADLCPEGIMSFSRCLYD